MPTARWDYHLQKRTNFDADVPDSEKKTDKPTWETLFTVATTPRNGGTWPARASVYLEKLIKSKDARLEVLLNDAATDDAHVALRAAVRDLVLTDMQSLWDEAMEGCSKNDANEICAQEKADKALSGSNLTYGEVEFKSLGDAMMQHCNGAHGGVFYDLGSGAGRGCFAALFLHDFDRVVGIEIMEGLYEASVRQQKHVETTMIPRLVAEEEKAASSHEDGHEKTSLPSIADQKLEFYCDDLNIYDWSDATVAFANSTCFNEDLMQSMSFHANKMKIGTYFFTLTRPLESEEWKTLEGHEYMMSWGKATIYAHIKIA